MTEKQDRRKSLKAKIEKSRSTLPVPRRGAGEIARTAAGNPFVILAGGLVVGLIAGALLPRRFGRKLVRYGVTGATIAGELGRTYGRTAIDSAGEAGRGAREKLGDLGESAGSYGRKALTLAERRTREGRDIGEKLLREGIRIASNLRH